MIKIIILLLSILLIQDLAFAQVDYFMDYSPELVDKYNVPDIIVPEVSDTNIINIKDMGAVGDGQTNDIASFIKAFKLLNVLEEGGILYLPKGVYLIEGQSFSEGGTALLHSLEIENNNIIIKGEGIDETRILVSYPENIDAAYRKHPVIKVSGKSGDAYHQLQEDGKINTRKILVKEAEKYFDVSDHVLLIADDSGPIVGERDNSKMNYFRNRNHLLIIEDINQDTIIFTEPLRINFLVENEARIEKYQPIRNFCLEDLTFASMNEADLSLIFLEYAYNCQIKNVVFSGYTRSAIRMWYAKGCIIDNNLIKDARWFGGGGEGYGVDLCYSHDNLIENNRIDLARHAVTINYGNGGNIIRNNQANDIAGAIDIHGEYNYYNIVEGNKVKDVNVGIVVGGGGVNVHYNDGPGNIIRNNEVINSGRIGIYADAQTHYSIIENNTIINSEKEAILNGRGSNFTIIRNNLIKNPARAAIVIEGNDIIIEDNIIQNPRGEVTGLNIKQGYTDYRVYNNSFGGTKVIFPGDK